jgi:hypothetical protein
MKKTILASAVALVIAGSAMAQPVSDRAVIPLGITLQQILRIHVVNGGNIEFVYNSLTDYKNGIANSSFYDTDVVIASSTDWTVHMGAEDATFLGTDNPANTLPLNFAAFIINTFGNNSVVGTQLDMVAGAYDNADAIANGLKIYTGVLATDGLLTHGAGATNGGDITDNKFTINWQSGITPAVGVGTTPASIISMLTQSPVPDRYVTNVLLELEAI